MLGAIVIAAIETQREVLAIISLNYNIKEIWGFKLKSFTIHLKRKI